MCQKIARGSLFLACRWCSMAGPLVLAAAGVKQLVLLEEGLLVLEEGPPPLVFEVGPLVLVLEEGGTGTAGAGLLDCCLLVLLSETDRCWAGTVATNRSLQKYLFPLFFDTHLFRRDGMWVWESGQTPRGLRA